MDFKAIFVASLLLVSFVGQAYSSTACFKCANINGTSNPDCNNNTQQYRFVTECSSENVLPPEIINHNRAANPTNEDKFKCVVWEAKNSTHSIFARSCIQSYLTCSLFETAINPFNVTLGTCRICDGDLCNSSNRAGIAIFTLIPCLIAYTIFK